MGKRYLIVIDIQNDFVTGSLGTPEAEAIVEPATAKARSFDGEVVFTKDTHGEDYLETQEGRNLPVPHCIKGSWGWELVDGLEEVRRERGARVFEKVTFGSTDLAEMLTAQNAEDPIESIELIGLCTDICVVSNALLIKAFMPEVPVGVDASCCAGVTPEAHEAALVTMRSCQIHVD